MTRIRLDQSNRRIRARRAGEFVGDTNNAQLVFVEGRHPEYAFPSADVDHDWSDSEEGRDELGAFERHHTGDRRYVDGPAEGLVTIDFDSVDAWFEEDEQLIYRPRDPYRRVDVLESSRHLKVTIDGTLVAESRRPRLVDETGLPPRWYVPVADIDWSPLIPSTTTSVCQYKGVASWWIFAPNPNTPLVDIAWSYDAPIPEAPKLAGLVSFLAEHDHVSVTVDDEPVLVPSFDPSWVSPSLHLDDGRPRA